MIPNVAWLILFLPLFAFALLISFFRPKGLQKIGSYVSILAVGSSFVLSLIIFSGIISAGGQIEPLRSSLPFIHTGEYQFPFSIQIDALTSLMLVVVTSVSLLVQIYSLSYMEGDPGFGRYYAYLSLFTTSMLGLVLSQDLLLVFAFWELVGLSSFLLIGFWFDRPSAAEAAKKAFLTTRFGDFGFLVALLMFFLAVGSLDIPTIIEHAEHGQIAIGFLTLACLGLFAGAAGKSAQFPLHVWLPDAMEGPTPVSALIHAATMVAAGVYLVARMFPLFEAAPSALNIVAWIGGFTALFAATIGLTQHDIKRVMAYSTVSQLGYMMLGLGMGNLAAGMFHLFTHAFFKALLFLGCGSVIHGTGTQDMREMGGLRKYMPVTFATFAIGALSLAGIFPFAGFWSKDEILAVTFESGNAILFIFGEITVFLTAFYITRLMVLTFFGEYRGPNPELALETAGLAGGHTDQRVSDHDEHADAHNGDDAAPAAHDNGHTEHHGEPHESPWLMKLPLIVLAIPATIAGFWSIGGAFNQFMQGVPGVEKQAPPFNYETAIMSAVLALAGIGISWAIYSEGPERAREIGEAFGPIYRLVYNKYYVDEFYNHVILGGVLFGISRFLAWFDTNIVDGVVNGTADFALLAGNGLRRWQTGRVQYYGAYMFLGAIILFVVGLAGGGFLRR